MWRAVTFLAFVTPTLGDPILTSHLGSYQQPSYPSLRAPPPPVAPLEYGPSCPDLGTFRIACRKGDKLCCLPSTFTTEVDDTFPFSQQTCPVTDATTAENICAALEANSTFVEPGARLLPAGQITTTGDWVSDRYAAIAAIGSPDLCFNIYPHIMPGDVLDSSCLNTLIGDPVDALRSMAQGSTIATGGNLVIQSSSLNTNAPTLNGAMLVLGDLTVTEAPASVMVAGTTVFTGPGPFNGVGSLVGGAVSIFDAGVQIVVTGGSAVTFISSSTFSGPFANGATVVDTAPFIEQFDAFFCSAFNQILALDNNGIPTYSNGGADLTLDCNGGGEGLCVITTTAEELQDVTTLTRTLNAYDSAIVRVTGGGGDTFTLPFCNVAGSCTDFLFVFTEADSINLSVVVDAARVPTFPLFAPVATAVNINWTGAVLVDPFIIIAGSGSTISMTDTDAMQFLTTEDEWELPEQTVYDVIFCSCACDPNDLPVHKEEKTCIKTPYGYGQSSY